MVLSGSGAGSGTAQQGGETVEEVVLGRLEFVDVLLQLGTEALHGLGVPRGLPMIALGDGRLRDQGAETRLVGLFGEVEELLVGDVQFPPQLAEPGRHLGEAPLDERPGHGSSVGQTGRVQRGVIVLVLVLAVLAAGCGSSSSTASCDPIIREELDPASSVHVLPTAADVDYASDPPTSGPHQPTPRIEGRQDEPLLRPVQVGIVEDGGILLQFDPDAFPDPTEFDAIANDPVVVAPNPDLDDPIVLTAWTAKQTCGVLDAVAVQAFVDDRAGQAPGSDG